METNLVPKVSRRSIMTGSGAGMLAGAALLAGANLEHAQALPDAELIRLCAKFDALEQKRDESFSGIEDDDERDAFVAPIVEQQDALTDQILEMQPRTLEGFKALARSIAIWAPDMIDDSESTGLHSDLIRMLLLGLVGESGV